PHRPLAFPQVAVVERGPPRDGQRIPEVVDRALLLLEPHPLARTRLPLGEQGRTPMAEDARRHQRMSGIEQALDLPDTMALLAALDIGLRSEERRVGKKRIL